MTTKAVAILSKPSKPELSEIDSTADGVAPARDPTK